MSNAKAYFRYLVNEIHTTIVATVDDDGLPVTAAIDMMDCDDSSLYFLTAKGKGFYDRLIKRGFLAFTALKGADTLSSVALSVRGKVRELGYGRIPDLFEKNPYMHQIYPTDESMRALTVFQVYEGTGKWFDLSKKPIERAAFTFGGAEKKAEGVLYLGCLYRVREMHRGLSAELYRGRRHPAHDSTGTLPALRKLPGCLSCWSG